MLMDNVVICKLKKPCKLHFLRVLENIASLGHTAAKHNTVEYLLHCYIFHTH